MSGETRKHPITCLLAHADIGPREVLAEALGQIGMRIEAVGSLEECAQSLETGGVDLIVTSLALSDAKAWELERLARQAGKCSPTLQIIVLCAASLYENYLPVAQERNCELIPEDDLSHLNELVERAIKEHKKPSVLVIEDNLGLAEVARQALVGDFEVEVQYDGLSALDAWQSRRHHLVLLDLQLPSLDGAELLKLIKQESPSQLVLVISGVLEKYRRDKLLATGATDILAKPYPIEELPARCHHVLRHGAMLRAAEDSAVNRANFEQVSISVALAQRSLVSGQSVLTKKHLEDALDICGTAQEGTDDELVYLEARAKDRVKPTGPLEWEGQA